MNNSLASVSVPNGSDVGVERVWVDEGGGTYIYRPISIVNRRNPTPPCPLKALSARRRRRALHAADSFLSLLLFFPSMLCYWRGIWDLLGVYILPEHPPPLSHWLTTGIGACALLNYFTLPLLDHWLSRDRRVTYFLVTRLHMIVMGGLSMAYWRGVWSLAEHYLGPYGWKAGLGGLGVGYVNLLLLMASRSLVFTPFMVTRDTDLDLLTATTCLGTKFAVGDGARAALFYSLDALLTQYLVGTLTILSWRSIFTLLEIILEPLHDPAAADVLCLGAGFFLSAALFALDAPLLALARALEARHGRGARIVWEDTVYLVVFLVMALLWRGAWNLDARYVLADPLVGGWVHHVVGLVLLLGLQLMSFVGGCGCTLDGSGTARDGIFETEYLRKCVR